MIPTLVRVSLTLKDVIEDKVNKGESNIILTPHITYATLDVIGLVGKKKNIYIYIYIFNMNFIRYLTL